MVKSTRKPAAPRKPKSTVVPLSKTALKDLTKAKAIRKTLRQSLSHADSERIGSLLNEEVLTCPICLQLLLSPVLAQCGHTFCLYCVEDLAKHGFACGICHTHLPSYELHHSNIIEKLLDDYLCREGNDQTEKYERRKQEMERKQENRRLRQVEEGHFLDFWCQEQHSWKSGTVMQKMKNGLLTITGKKGNNEVQIHTDSRRLAPHRLFSKDDQPPLQQQQIQLRPVQLMPNSQFEPIRMNMEERPPIFGMPLFLGYYWRGDDFLSQGSFFDNQDPFTF